VRAVVFHLVLGYLKKEEEEEKKGEKRGGKRIHLLNLLEGVVHL